MTGMPTFSFDVKAKLKQIFGAKEAPKAAEEDDKSQRRTVCPDNSRRTMKAQRKAAKKNRVRTTEKGMSSQESPRRQGGAKQPPITYKLQPKSIISDLPYQPSNVKPDGIQSSVRTVKGNGLGNKGVSYHKNYYHLIPKIKHMTQGEYPPRQNHVHLEVPAVITLPAEREAAKVSVRNAIVAKQTGKYMQALKDKEIVKPITPKLRKKAVKSVTQTVPTMTKKQRKKLASAKAAKVRAAQTVAPYIKAVPEGAAIEDPFKLRHLALERANALRLAQTENRKHRERMADHQDELSNVIQMDTVRRKVKRTWIAEARKAKGVTLKMARKKYRDLHMREVA